MANRIKLKGTTERAFDLGLTNKQTFDASNLTANRTWVLPDSNGSPNYVLATNGSGNLSWVAQTGGGGNGVPGGNTTEVQFNDAGSFGGDADFTWNKTTNTLTLAGDITAVDSITFDTTAAETSAVAKLYWDNGDGTISSGLKGGNVTARLGQNLYTLVYNAEASTMTKGQVVYIFGAQGQRPSVKLARADADVTSARTFGVVAETITAGGEGFVCIEGDVDNINTLGLTEGGQLYLSGTTAGAYTQTKPQAPIHLVYVGVCLKANATSGRIQVKVQNGYELDELHDVKITTPVTANSVLQYDSANSLWINNAPSTAINNLLPTQSGNTGNFLTTNGSVASWAYAVTGAAGSNTQIQFNANGLFAASSQFDYSEVGGTNSILEIGNTYVGQINLGSTTGNAQTIIGSTSIAVGASTTGNGRQYAITGASAAANGRGGNIQITAGLGSGSGAGGELFLSAGAASFSGTGVGGNVYITPGTNSDSTARGNIVLQYYGGNISVTGNGAIAINGVSGNTNQVLTSQGSGSPPIWANATGGGATIDDCIVYAIALS